MRRLILFVCCVGFTLICLCAANKPDLKYLSKCAEFVWGLDLPQFDPTFRPDSSIYENASAVYLASYTGVTADHEEVEKLGRFTPAPGVRVAKNNVRHINRQMVLLKDVKAINEFSDFEFDVDESESLGNNVVTAYEYKYAFGARIHKPNGKIVNVDMSTTLTETSGKKGNDAVCHKIAIPGLEVGDVLEYFYLSDLYMLGNQSVDFDVEVFEKYPVCDFRLDMRINPRYTTVINTFNGMPVCKHGGWDKDDRIICELELHDLQAFNSQSWIKPRRQLPFMRVDLSDNYSNLLPSLKSARPPGLYFNSGTVPVLKEIAERMSAIEIPSKDLSTVLSIVRNYCKTHPEMTEDDLADVTWLATLYAAFISKDDYEVWRISAMYKDALDRLDLTIPVNMAVTTSRERIVVDEIGDYKQVTPLVLVGDRPFLYMGIMSFAPGEVPGSFAGEKALTLTGKRSELFNRKEFGASTLPATNTKANTQTIEASVTIPDVNGTGFAVEYTNTIRGLYKIMGELMVTPDDFIARVEDFFSIPKKQRFGRKTDVLTHNRMRNSFLAKLPEIDFDINDCKIDTSSVVSVGFLPDESDLKYRIAFTSDMMVSHAGEDLVVNLPALALHPENVEDEKNEREISIFTEGPYTLTSIIELRLPDGYTVDQTDLDHLQVNYSNVCGAFYVKTEIKPDGNLRMTVVRRNLKTYYHPERWSDFLSLREKASSFASSSLVLHKESK